jgi:3-phenylpropionate/trans-cinnamate dioxygenase ferredoxin subunit
MPAYQIGSLSNVPPGSVAAFDLAGTPVAVANVDGALYALNNICSHAHALLSEGELDIDDCTLSCPLHGSVFDLQSGKPRSFPAFEPVATYTVWAEGDALFVEYPA